MTCDDLGAIAFLKLDKLRVINEARDHLSRVIRLAVVDWNDTAELIRAVTRWTPLYEERLLSSRTPMKRSDDTPRDQIASRSSRARYSLSPVDS